MKESIQRITKANHDYLSNPTHFTKDDDTSRREQLAMSQSPHTMVLACADSRVPVEKILNGSIGDYFVVRSAGNVAETSQIASLEFGAAVLGADTLLVLGHTKCGAVSAAVEVVTEKKTLPSQHLTKLAQMITPAVTTTLKDNDLNKEECIRNSTKENVHHQINTILDQSEILTGLEKDGKLKILGGVYDIKTGEIEIINS